MKKLLSIMLSIFTLAVISCQEITYGITLRDKKEKFSIFSEGSAASEIVQAEDDSVSWISTAAGGGGGGVSFIV